MPSEDTQFQNDPSRINKNGRPPDSAAVKALKRASATEIIDAYGKILGMTKEEATAYKDSTECSLTEYALIINMLRGNFEPVLDRIIGSIPKTVNLNPDIKFEKIDTTGMTEDEKRKLYIEKASQVSGKK